MSRRGRPPIPTEVLLDDLRRVADLLERKPLVREYKKHGEYSVTIFYDRFESWDEAVGAAIGEERYVPCEECDQTFRTKAGYAGHYRTQHTKINPQALAEADPEDFGLSPIGNREVGDG